jgi:hypothetical protein
MFARGVAFSTELEQTVPFSTFSELTILCASGGYGVSYCHPAGADYCPNSEQLEKYRNPPTEDYALNHCHLSQQNII